MHVPQPSLTGRPTPSSRSVADSAPRPLSMAGTANPPLARAAAGALIAGGVTVLACFLVNPGPGLSAVHHATYTGGHLLNGLGYLLIVLGLPVLAWSLADSLRLPGTVGYVALVARFVLSTGSQLFQATVYRTLSHYPYLHPRMAPGQTLSTIYGGAGDTVTLILAIASLPLAWTLWRSDRSLRAAAALLVLSALIHVLITPLGLITICALLIWLGLRILIRGDVRRPLRPLSRDGSGEAPEHTPRRNA